MTSSARPDRLWLGGGLLAGLIVLVLAWFVAIGPELSAAGELRDQTAAAETQNAVAQAKVGALRNEFAQIDSLSAQLQEVRRALPVDSGLSSFTRQLTEQARTAGVAITSITTAAPALATPSGAASSAPAGSATTAPAAPASSGSSAAAAPAVPSAQLFAIPVTVVVNGTLNGQRDLVRAIQVVGPRRALVSSVVLAPSTGGPVASTDTASTMTLQLMVFAAPVSLPDQAAPSAPPS